MKKKLVVALSVVGAVALLAGIAVSANLLEFHGTVSKLDRGKGQMVVNGMSDEPKYKGRTITINDNERHVLSKNDNLKTGKEVYVNYEKQGKSNVVKKYRIIKGGC